MGYAPHVQVAISRNRPVAPRCCDIAAPARGKECCVRGGLTNCGTTYDLGQYDFLKDGGTTAVLHTCRCSVIKDMEHFVPV